ERDLELPLPAVTEARDQMVAPAFEMHGVHDRFRLHHGAVVGARPRQGEAAAGSAAAGAIDGIADAEPAEELRYLIRPPQSAPDPLMHRQRGDVFVEEADAAGRRQEIAGDGVEQRGLARAVGTDDRAPLA